MALAHQQQEEKNKRIAAGVSAGVHVLILLFLIYMLAWRAPDPPAPEYGIELNFGMDAVGSGDVQSEAVPNESQKVEDSAPAPTQPDPQPEPVAQPTPPQPAETPAVTTTTAEAPVAVKEEVKPQPKPQPKEEVVKKDPAPVIRKEALMGKRTDNTGTGKAGTSEAAAGNNNGNDADAVGDKGIREGSLMSKNYEGKPGAGAGGSLDMAGWGWGDVPRPRDTSSETGKIVIKITVNGDGIVENAVVVESTVSPQVTKIYRDEVFRRATFVRTGSNAANSAGATGFVTYIIRTR